MEKQPRLFLSYNSNDSIFADIVEREIHRITNNRVRISRYTKSVNYKGSFKEFMNSIEEFDYVLCIVSDYYLKSHACMYEVGEVIKDHNYGNKLLFVVLGNDDTKYVSDNKYKNIVPEIYDATKRISYIKYWQEKYFELKREIDGLDDESKRKPSDTLYEYGKIYKNDIGVFLDFLSDSKGMSFDELYNNQFVDIIRWIFPDWDKRKFIYCRNFNELLTSAIKEIHKTTNTDYNQIALRVKISSHQYGLVVFADDISKAKQSYRLVVVGGLMSQVASTGKWNNVSNTKAEESYFNAVDETQSELVVPIKIDGNTIGVINSEAEKTYYYSDRMVSKIKDLSEDFADALIRLKFSSNTSYDQIPYVHVDMECNEV